MKIDENIIPILHSRVLEALKRLLVYVSGHEYCVTYPLSIPKKRTLEKALVKCYHCMKFKIVMF